MTFKPTMALLIQNRCQRGKLKVLDGKKQKKLKIQHEDRIYFMCMLTIPARSYKSPATL